MKFITAVAAFAVTFGFSAFLTNFLGLSNQSQFQTARTNRTGQEISSFLQQDIENGEEMDAVCESVGSISEYSEAVGEYADASGAMEDVNFPPDFRFAWQAHMNAWRSHADFLDSNDFSSSELTEKEFLQAYTNQRVEIERTWLNVLNIGKKYGAIIPPNAY